MNIRAIYNGLVLFSTIYYHPSLALSFIHNPPHNNPLSFLPICNCPRYFPAIFIIRTESPVNVVHALFKIAPPGTKIGFQETREGDNFSLNDLTILPPFLPTFGYTSVCDRTRGYHLPPSSSQTFAQGFYSCTNLFRPIDDEGGRFRVALISSGSR